MTGQPNAAAKDDTLVLASRRTRPFYWSVRRELWENRWIYLVPLAAAGAVLVGYLIGMLHLPRELLRIAAFAPEQQSARLAELCGRSAIPMILAGLVVSAIYCLGALNGERRDRSILFWKSLPVSDTTTILSKISIPLVIMPLMVFAITVALQIILLVVSTGVTFLSNSGTHLLWTRLPLIEMTIVMLYGLTLLALWQAPIYAWLLLVSGWARRAPILWAALPPLALCAVEKVAFNTTHILSFLGHRLHPRLSDAFAVKPEDGTNIYRLAQLAPAKLLSLPDVWIGLAVAALLLTATVVLRRYRGRI
jgi:ABC-2 type transport system permease protein